MPLYAELILDDIALNGTRVLVLERLNAVDLVARTSRPAAHASATRTTFPEASTESTLPFELPPLDDEVSWVNRSPPLPVIPELISSFVFGAVVQIPIRPFAVIRNASNPPIQPFCTTKSGRVEIGPRDVLVTRTCTAGSAPVSEITDDQIINLILLLGVAVNIGRKFPPPPLTTLKPAPEKRESEKENKFGFVQKLPIAP